jgi:hypothetical protein
MHRLDEPEPFIAAINLLDYGRALPLLDSPSSFESVGSVMKLVNDAEASALRSSLLLTPNCQLQCSRTCSPSITSGASQTDLELVHCRLRRMRSGSSLSTCPYPCISPVEGWTLKMKKHYTKKKIRSLTHPLSYLHCIALAEAACSSSLSSDSLHAHHWKGLAGLGSPCRKTYDRRTLKALHRSQGHCSIAWRCQSTRSAERQAPL